MAGSVLAPIVLSFSSLNQFSLVDVAAALVGAAGIAAAVGVAVSSRLPVRMDAPAIAAGSFITWMTVSAFASGRGWSAFMGEPAGMLGLGVLVSLAAVGIAGRALGDVLRSLLGRYGWLVLAFECLLAFSQLAQSEVATGTLPNSTILGIVVVMLLPWTIVLRDRSPKWESYARWATAVAAIAVLAAAGSRVALVVALAWGLWAVVRRTPWSGRAKTLVVVGVSILVASAAISFAGAEFRSSLTVAVFGERPAMWRMSGSAVAQRPILGWGPDGFLSGAAATSTLKVAEQGQLLMVAPGASDPHDLLVWVAVSSGVVGLILFIWFCSTVVLAWRKGGRESGLIAAMWGVSGAFVVYLTAPAAIQTLPLFALLVGLSLREPWEESQTLSVDDRAVVIQRFCLAAIALLCAMVGANALTRASLEQASPQRSPALARSALSASNLLPFDAHLAYLGSLHWGYLSQVDAASAAQRVDLALIQKAVELDRRSPLYATEAALTLQSHRESVESISAAYDEVFRRYPAYPLARARFARFLAAIGDVNGATRQLELARLITVVGSAELDAAVAEAQQAIQAAQ